MTSKVIVEFAAELPSALERSCIELNCPIRTSEFCRPTGAPSATLDDAALVINPIMRMATNPELR
jgi:hypothetical protein